MTDLINDELREEVRDWMAEHLVGDFAQLRARGGPGDEHSFVAERQQWERLMAKGGWTCVGWPTKHGGRGLPLEQEVIFHEEYARAGGPGRAGLIGEGLLGPTLIHFGTDAHQKRFLPGIVAGTEYWCQGYSEPNAGSDLANVSTHARLEGDEWVITGQKVWTSLAQWSDWCFVIARTDPGTSRHQGLSYLLVPLDQPGVEIRPIRQLTGSAEFNEVFFDAARTASSLAIGGAGQGWKVAMGTLAFERGALTLGQQMAFQREFGWILEAAAARRPFRDPGEQAVLTQRLVQMWIRLRIMRWNAERTLAVADGELTPEAMVHKLYWANLHRDMGNLGMDALGTAAALTRFFSDSEPSSPESATFDEMGHLHKLFFFSRSDTIYGGSNQIQRNVVGERALGLPREPRGPT